MLPLSIPILQAHVFSVLLSLIIIAHYQKISQLRYLKLTSNASLWTFRLYGNSIFSLFVIYDM